MLPQDYCRSKAAPDGSSLHYSLLFIDQPRQQAIIAVHAFREEIAGIVRNCSDIEPAFAKLAWWRMEIQAMFEQRPDHPVTRALAEALPRFTIAQEPLLEIIDGYEMDLQQGDYVDFKSLQLYCYRVSGTVSTICSEILGYKNRQTAKFAHELGIAAQLTAIVRNVGIDARHGRIYLPGDELEAFGVAAEELFNHRPGTKDDDKLKSLLAFQTRRIRALYGSALSHLAADDRKTQRAALALAAIQQATLAEIEHEGFQVLDRRLSLTPLRKLWIASKTWLLN